MYDTVNSSHLFDTGSVVELSEVLADVQIVSLVLPQLDHVRVELQLQLGILGVFKESRGDLLGNDLCSDVILGGKTESHLLQNQFNFLFPLHGAVGFNLN